MILIKYGELTTKKANRKEFVRQLEKNIKEKLDNIEYKLIRNNVRMFIKTDQENEVIKRLHDVFGIHSVCKTIEVINDIEIIKEKALELISKEKFKTFKVETNRSNKEFPLPSIKISREVGGYILHNLENITVDVHNPDMLLKVEIRKDETYIYIEETKGIGGYPVGIAGKGLVMISGGIDSPVAAYLSMKRGVKIECIYFEALPHTSLKAREKVINLCKKLCNYQTEIKLHIVSFTEIQESIYKNIDKTYMITIMRRMMYRISEKLAYKTKCKVLINGESIGQVASQTLTSMKVINEVTNLPVIRPVACFDKIEIIEISKLIDTYKISIEPYEDCCTVFVPKHPVINPNLEKAIEYEENINYLDMIEKSVKEINTIIINNIDNKQDIL